MSPHEFNNLFFILPRLLLNSFKTDLVRPGQFNNKMVLDHLVIELAWSDKVSFEAIELQTGKNEKQVIELMRRHLKASSFKLWRSRVNGRRKKHEKLSPPTG